MNLRYIILLLFTLCNKLPAQKFTVFGYVKDNSTGESLIGAPILIEGANSGTVTNNYGFYSITLPHGENCLKYSFIGYEPIVKEVDLEQDIEIDVNLNPSSTHLKEVIVKSGKTNRSTSNEMGTQTISIETLKKLPNTIGEIDIIKGLQLLPGIQTSNEGTTNLSVRGGSFDQNLILLDEAPLYNPSHALGFFSVFNPDAIKMVKVYKSAFPAQYGGRLSSIVDIHMKEGNTKELSCNGGLGIIASRFTLEAPIVRDKSSFLISGRYSYTGFTVNTFGNLGQQAGLRSLRNFRKDNEIGFYDLNAKANYIIDNKNRIYLSAYSGKDDFFYHALDNANRMSWGNLTSTLRWNHIFSSKLFANILIAYSKYDYSYTLKDDARNFRWFANLKELDFKTDFDYSINLSNQLKYGVTIEGHEYFPGEIEPRDSSSITEHFKLEEQKSLIGALYISNEQKINNHLSLTYGLRYSFFCLMGKSTVYTYSSEMIPIDTTYYNQGDLVQFYQGLEPRISFRYLLSPKSSIKASFTKTNQYQHLISSSSIGNPSDVWLPSNQYFKPQHSIQYSIGFYKELNEEKYEFSVETYIRTMSNVIDYKDNADLFLNEHIETQILIGKGKSIGVEFFLEKKYGDFKGWISYTLSKTTRKIDGVNSNNPYPATFDKRHNISLVLNYSISKTWSMSSIFKFTSGGYATVPSGTFIYYGATFNYYTSRNGYKLPSYHRLDFSFNYRSKKNETRRFKTEWDFGIYNVYGRKNIFSLFVKQDNVDFDASKAYKMYLYGITPYATFNFKF